MTVIILRSDQAANQVYRCSNSACHPFVSIDDPSTKIKLEYHSSSLYHSILFVRNLQKLEIHFCFYSVPLPDDYEYWDLNPLLLP
jgi:hypothetical protein